MPPPPSICLFRLFALSFCLLVVGGRAWGQLFYFENATTQSQNLNGKVKVQKIYELNNDAHCGQAKYYVYDVKGRFTNLELYHFCNFDSIKISAKGERKIGYYRVIRYSEKGFYCKASIKTNWRLLCSYNYDSLVLKYDLNWKLIVKQKYSDVPVDGYFRTRLAEETKYLYDSENRIKTVVKNQYWDSRQEEPETDSITTSYSSSGVIISKRFVYQIHHDPKQSYEAIANYSTVGHVVDSTVFKKGKPISKLVWFYDSLNRLSVVNTFCLATDSLVATDSLFYNPAGELIKRKFDCIRPIVSKKTSEWKPKPLGPINFQEIWEEEEEYDDRSWFPYKPGDWSPPSYDIGAACPVCDNSFINVFSPEPKNSKEEDDPYEAFEPDLTNDVEVERKDKQGNVVYKSKKIGASTIRQYFVYEYYP